MIRKTQLNNWLFKDAINSHKEWPKYWTKMLSSSTGKIFSSGWKKKKKGVRTFSFAKPGKQKMLYDTYFLLPQAMFLTEDNRKEAK